MLPVPVVDQGVQIVCRRKDDISAFAPVTTVGAAELDELLTAKAGGAAAAVTALQVDLALIEKLHRIEIKKGNGRAAPLRLRAFRGEGYSAACAGSGAAGGSTDT